MSSSSSSSLLLLEVPHSPLPIIPKADDSAFPSMGTALLSISRVLDSISEIRFSGRNYANLEALSRRTNSGKIKNLHVYTNTTNWHRMYYYVICTHLQTIKGPKFMLCTWYTQGTKKGSKVLARAHFYVLPQKFLLVTIRIRTCTVLYSLKE